MNIRSAGLRSAILCGVAVGAFGFAGSASAQTAPPTPQSGPGEAKDTVVVTGTRIATPNIDSPVPVTVISGDELNSTGNVSLGDVLNQLPQLRSTFTQANSQRFIGTSGINALDLRGLGAARTLVLVNGNRVVTSTPGINRPDVNNIPADLLDRVDIVTGGNSAVYGSDAVSGVVNFILKDDFDGVRVRSQGGISSRDDRGTFFTSLTAGKNYADGRGNIAFSAEYAHQNTLRNTTRDGQTGAFSGRNQFNLVENTGANLNPGAGPLKSAEPAEGNGVFDNNFFRGIKNNNISEGGLFTAACPTVAATGESAAAFAARRAVACSGLANPGSANTLSQFGNTFVFNSDGTLTKNNCTTDFRPFGSSNCLGGDGSTLRLTGFLEPGLTRKAVNVLWHDDFTPWFAPYVRAQYVEVEANQEGQPTFFNNTFSVNNPFLTQQAKNTLTAVLAPGATTFAAQRFNIDFGGRGEKHQRTNYAVTAGVTGDFFDTWKYEVSYNYGHLKTYYETAGNVDLAKYSNSINAVRNTAGTIVCAINNDAITTNDDLSCSPVNLFGNGAPQQAALNYFGYTSHRDQKADLYDLTAYVAGDTGFLFSLPGGPISFVVGGEERRETAFAAYDDFTAAGNTFLNSIPEFKPPGLTVKDLFGELRMPLLRDLPFVHELTLDASARASDYNIGKTNAETAYSFSAIYAPIEDLKFRISKSRAIRAPTQSDLYAPQSQTFLNGLVDPCGQQNINNNPNRVANCAAAGVPTTQTFTVGGATTTEPFSNRPASGVSGFNGSNPNLDAEASDSISVGLVYQPSFMPGMSLSVDYYEIEIQNVIFSLAAQTIINQCYDSSTGINNPFCAAVFRNPNGTFKGQSDVGHAGTTVSLTTSGASFISGPFNFAKQRTNGIDVNLDYRVEFSPGWTANIRSILSHTFEKNNFTDVTNPNFALRQLGTLGDPEWQGQVSANVEHGMFNFGYRFRYVGEMTVAGTYEAQNSFQGRAPTNLDQFPGVTYAAGTYSDFRLDIQPEKGPLKYYLGIDNAFDQLPPLDLLGTEGGNPYSPVGRFYYAGVELKF